MVLQKKIRMDFNLYPDRTDCGRWRHCPPRAAPVRMPTNRQQISIIPQKKILLLFFILINCQVYAQRNNFADVLNLQTTVSDTNNIEKNCFSDFGAWHAYSLPQRKEDYGSFIGPLLMDMNGQWLADNFAQLHLSGKWKRN